jgi:hypothetical protein
MSEISATWEAQVGRSLFNLARPFLKIKNGGVAQPHGNSVTPNRINVKRTTIRSIIF